MMGTDVKPDILDVWGGWLCGGFLFWLAFVCLGYYVARQKRRPDGEALALGGIFGPFGVLILALLPNGRRERREPAPVKPVAAPPPAPMPAPAPSVPAVAPVHPKGFAFEDDGGVKLTCQCGRPAKVSAARAGTTVKCPLCGVPIMVPKRTPKPTP